MNMCGYVSRYEQVHVCVCVCVCVCVSRMHAVTYHCNSKNIALHGESRAFRPKVKLWAHVQVWKANEGAHG
jgi:hypothetical protein